MLPYQSFYPQMNNNYQVPMQNPYMDRMAQLQQYQQSLQSTQVSGANQQMNVIGKIVDSIDVVKATDVPMDGNMYYFPKADGTEIFGKQWLSNGQTRILTFKPDLDTEPNNVSNTDEKLKIGLSDDMFDKVLCHELVHVYSFENDCDIDIQTEEIIANFMSLFGRDIIYLLDDLVKILKRVA